MSAARLQAPQERTGSAGLCFLAAVALRLVLAMEE
jgi:hypothetical protein